MILSDLKDWMAGEDCVVVGCGPSAKNDTRDPNDIYTHFWSFACNRAVEWFPPDFAVCVEPFRDKMWDVMREASPMIIFSHICENQYGRRPRKRIVQIGSKNVLEWLAPDTEGTLRLGQSPFYAVAVAAHLGFETVGLIGVDLTEDRWPDVTGINRVWETLLGVVGDMGTKVVNLSPTSRLTAVPQGSWEEVRTK